MDNQAKCVVLILGLSIEAVAIAVLAGSIANGGLRAETVYLTGVGLLMMGGGFLSTVPLYQRINDLEQQMDDHKTHDRQALTEAMLLGKDTPPSGVSRMRR